MKKIFYSFMVFALMLIPMSVFAIDYQGSIGISFKYDEKKVSNVNFSLYQIATYDNEGNIQVSDGFEKYSEKIKNYNDETISTLTKDLSSYVTTNNIVSYAEKKNTDSLLIFDKLDKGIYLVIGNDLETDEGVYIPQTVLVAIPTIVNGEVSDSVIIEPKCDFRHWIDVDVRLEWNDENNPKRPKEVVVQLVKDGEVVDEVTLSEENNWEYHWEDLVEGDYDVVQKLPDGYTEKITKDGNHFTIVDKFTKKEILPATGQLWLPVILLISGGIVLIFISLFMKKRVNKN